jgi:hypothetical protein
MPKLRESTTAVLVRGERVAGGYASEPYEAGWASEAVVFVLGMDDSAGGDLHLQISPDGMNWIDEGPAIELPAARGVGFGRIAHFGNWLRFELRLPEGAERRITLTLHLKG